ncbi:MAG: hypothetical protein ABR961_12675 [Thermoanaerobaculaceae bacterium]
MPKYKIAHVKEQGVDLIIVFVEPRYGSLIEADQTAFMADVQMQAHAAGLAGTVVPVWDLGGGRMGFRAPRGLHPFFESISLDFVLANVNRELSW